VIHRDYHLARHYLGMLEYLGDGKKRSARNVMLLQNFLPIGRGALA
jgi:hypothetical protein